jgi:hypothetical protein
MQLVPGKMPFTEDFGQHQKNGEKDQHNTIFYSTKK